MAAAVTALLPWVAAAGTPVDVEIFDRTSGEVLQIHRHHGNRYLAGEPGHEYEIRLRNRQGARLLAVTSVDGVNVVTGRTASFGQSGYVIDPYSQVSIDGWRKSLDEVAAFYFTSLPDSYAARTGRPDNVGVIGVAIFRERPKIYPIAVEPADESNAAAQASGAARSRAPGAAERADSTPLGTGHGSRHDSYAQQVEFERASEEPDSVIRLYYDSRRNLIARGVIRPGYSERRLAGPSPEPFPESAAFVPDP
jgi:hypothetical protein